MEGRGFKTCGIPRMGRQGSGEEPVPQCRPLLRKDGHVQNRGRAFRDEGQPRILPVMEMKLEI
jgi:hypothetical protein